MSNARASRTPTMKIDPRKDRIEPRFASGGGNAAGKAPGVSPSFSGEIRTVLQDVAELIGSTEDEISALFTRLEPVLGVAPDGAFTSPPEELLTSPLALELAGYRQRLRMQLFRLRTLESLIAL